MATSARGGPPFRAEHIGSFLRPPALESADQIKRRIEEASAYVDIDRLALSPQCGFASLYTGNPITFADQVNKLRLIVEVTRDVWDYTPAAAG